MTARGDNGRALEAASPSGGRSPIAGIAAALASGLGLALVGASCGAPPCTADKDCPASAPICVLSECGATEPAFFGELNQPCTASGVCDDGLRCVEDDGDPETKPHCRAACSLAVDAAPCATGFQCLEVPSTPGQGACVPAGM